MRKLLIGMISILVIAITGFFAYIWWSGGSGAVSQEIETVAQPIEDAPTGTLFRIDSDDSEATFTLEEDLTGIRTTVTGRTRQVGGDVLLNFDNPQASQVGVIIINARNFATDQEMRNRAIRSQILLTNQDENEFIVFAPTRIDGLPESVTVGETYTFQIQGDLTIIAATNPVIFETTVTLDSDTQISGSASATILYADWDITVPDAVGVANVTDDVVLTINFEADAVPTTE